MTPCGIWASMPHFCLYFSGKMREGRALYGLVWAGQIVTCMRPEAPLPKCRYNFSLDWRLYFLTSALSYQLLSLLRAPPEYLGFWCWAFSAPKVNSLNGGQFTQCGLHTLYVVDSWSLRSEMQMLSNRPFFLWKEECRLKARILPERNTLQGFLWAPR